MICLKTDRLEIRNFVIDDWKDLQEVAVDKESSEYANYDYQFPISDSEVKGITDWFSKGDNFFAVQLISNGKVIGYISLNGEDEAERDLGYCFNSVFHGHGYATESCIAVINYAFDTVNLQRITAGTANLNFPSCKLLDRLGFIKISECITSFRKTPDGNPIEFVGSSFLLEKNNWIKRRLDL
jgi:RimJ/RimL family protein N-acetyltransferase